MMASNWSKGVTPNQGEIRSVEDENYILQYDLLQRTQYAQERYRKPSTSRLSLSSNSSHPSEYRQPYSKRDLGISHDSISSYRNQRLDTVTDYHTFWAPSDDRVLNPHEGERLRESHKVEDMITPRLHIGPQSKASESSLLNTTNILPLSTEPLMDHNSQEDLDIDQGFDDGPDDFSDLTGSIPQRKLEDELLIKLRTTSNCSWKEIVSIFQKNFGPKYTVPMMQMRYYRLRKQMRF